MASTAKRRTTRSERRPDRLRVIFRLRLADGAEDRFLAAYRQVRHRVAQVDGYLGDQLCQSEDDPDDWVITSEWASSAHFHAWEAGADHRALAAPLMACVTSRESLRYHVRLATAPPGGVGADHVDHVDHGLLEVKS